MDRVKEIVGIIVGGKLTVDGKGRTFAKAPVWLAGMLALSSMKLALLTALLVVAFDMRVRINKA